MGWRWSGLVRVGTEEDVGYCAAVGAIPDEILNPSVSEPVEVPIQGEDHLADAEQSARAVIHAHFGKTDPLDVDLEELFPDGEVHPQDGDGN